MSDSRLVAWLAPRWVAVAGFQAAALLLLVPVVARTNALPLLLIYLHGPAYMAHQVEEHGHDAFRRFVDARLFGGRQALTAADVLVINIPFVWGVNIAAFYAAWAWGAGWGLVAPWLMLVNAIGHLAMGARLRGYNPGLATASCVFVPLALATLWVIRAPLAGHAFALGVALAIHAAIVILVIHRAAASARAPAARA